MRGPRLGLCVSFERDFTSAPLHALPWRLSSCRTECPEDTYLLGSRFYHAHPLVPQPQVSGTVLETGEVLCSRHRKSCLCRTSLDAEAHFGFLVRSSKWVWLDRSCRRRTTDTGELFSVHFTSTVTLSCPVWSSGSAGTLSAVGVTCHVCACQDDPSRPDPSTLGAVSAAP